MWAIILKEFRQLKRDRRTVAMLFMLPLFFLVVFGYAASFDVKTVPTIVVGPRARIAATRLPHQFDVVAIRTGYGYKQARDSLRAGRAIVAIVTPANVAAGKIRILIDGTELFAARAALTAFSQMAPALQTTGATTIKPEVLFNPGLKTSAIMIPGLCGVILVFVGTVATALGVVRERQAGTLEQLAVMPFKAREVLLGKIGPYLLIAAIDMIVIVLAGMLLFHVPFRGSPLTFALGAVFFLFVTLSIGVLISTVSQTQGQAIQLAIMTLLPQILLSGLFFLLSSMAAGVRWIGYCLPLTYFIKIARGVMVRGTPIADLWLPLLVLALMAIVIFTLATLRFRRDLAPTPARGARRPDYANEPAPANPAIGS